MSNFNHSVTLGSMCLLFWTALSAQDLVKPKTEKVVHYYKMAEEDAMSDLLPGYVQMMTWPSESHLFEARVDPSSPQVKNALDSTKEWVSRVLRPEWLPNYEKIEIFPLRHGFDGWDVIRFRYRVGEYVFQIASLSYSIWISVARYDRELKDAPLNLDNGMQYFMKTAPVFFQHSDQFGKRYSFKPVQKKKSVLCINRESGRWWETINWWTDGNAVMILCDKDDPSLKNGSEESPDWFLLPTVKSSK